MDAFYRHVRRETGVLIRRGRPVGGKFSFDTENRRAWRGKPPAPNPPRFPVDPIRQEVVDLVEAHFAQHPGRLDPRGLAATARDAERLWRWARRRCLPHFGPYEDAMSRDSRTLFHTQISPLLNNLRLLPARVVEDVARMQLPIASQEGFIRQVLGWREFVNHVHERTDGLRVLPDAATPKRRSRPGDGGYAAWAGRAWRCGSAPERIDGGACPSALGADAPMPPAFWGALSGLACLDGVVRDVWETGYGHHITRLMVLSNVATLLGVAPRELADWFWVAYTDAYDWVVEPNVLGMGTFAVGDLFTTKPYVSGAAYIARMSDFCRSCAFDPKRDCPLTSLYWGFLAECERALRGNPRLAMPLRSLARRPSARRAHDRAVQRWVRGRLSRGESLKPADRPTM
jgi:deoxyribodipyrimidine photolyase-related protein